ncbi:MAG: peptidylprolyl isomerase [Deltaproteobacteria bacterium]|nr:peptidylprolyl isomerase [Candidatus Zymogenaceae bacterium]
MDRGKIFLYGAVYAFVFIGALFPSMAYSVEVRDKVIAIVNDDVITMSELIAEGGDNVKGDPDSILGNGMTVREAQDIVLEQLIMRRLLDQSVKEYGLDVTSIDIDRVIAEQLKMNGMSRQDLMQLLAKEGKTYEEYKSEIDYSIKKERMISRRLSSHIIVTDDEIDAYFKEHQAEYKDRKEYRVSEIVLPIPANATESIAVETRNRADMVHNKLKSGASFETMAKEYSMVPDAEKGGDMGFIQPATLDPGFVSLLNKMKIGQVSDVIATENGFIIFKLTDTRPITNITVNDVKSEITAIIKRGKTITFFDRWMSDLRASAFVQKML